MSHAIEYVTFPSLDSANADGLLAMGGDLRVDTLVSAYAQGIFPWFNRDQPILWWSPDPRLVLRPTDFKVSQSLKKRLRRNEFTLSVNRDFEAVIEHCALRGSTADNRDSTWISETMQQAYCDLHHAGYAHSVEVWSKHALVGGLYGLCLGPVFFGESMFSHQSDASKVALFFWCQWLAQHQIKLIDCQIRSDHLLSLGAQEIARTEFLNYLSEIDIQSPNRFIGADFDLQWRRERVNAL